MDLEAEFSSRERQSFRRKLKAWFGKHGRDLPWRKTHDPYRIWVSEIMLQQTTVAAVIPYFERFLKRFPTVDDLASADIEDVLAHWEGLGYYRRGRSLHQAAQVLRDEHDSTFPSDLNALQKLPGIGRYTAGAIRSFAFKLPAPIVEANTQRVYARLVAQASDLTKRDAQSTLWSFAELIQPNKDADVINQALMELGSLVCKPTEPNCPECPVKTHCRAFANGRQNEIPEPKPRPEITKLVEVAVVTRKNDQFLLRQRQQNERWAGMWDFPRVEPVEVEYTQKLTATKSKNLLNTVGSLTDWDVADPQVLTEFRHSVTRYRIRLICVAGELAGEHDFGDEYAWYSAEELNELPMPVTIRKLVSVIQAKL